MNGRIIGALVAKDVKLYFRNRFFALITVLALVAYAGIYLIMPDSVDEELEVALYAPALPAALGDALRGEGLRVHSLDSEAALRDSIARGDYAVGFVLTDDALAKLAARQRAQINVYFSSDAPEEVKDAFVVLLKGLAYGMSGQAPNIEVAEEVLGPDLAGMQIPPRDRLRPLLAILIVTMETMGLASLISSEIEGGTLRALLVTPLRIEGLFVAKGITGVGLAFAQAALLMGAIGGLSQQPGLVLVALLLGALLVTGVGFLLASVSKDMIAVVGLGVLSIVVLSLPSLGVMFPGTITGWVKAIPSYYLVDAIHRATSFNAGWGEVWLNLLILLASATAILTLGTMVLRRKLR